MPTTSTLSSTVATVAPSARMRARRALIVAASFAVLAGSAGAQAPGMSGRGAFELRPYAGASIPTGEQRDFLKDAVLLGAQASWRATPAIAVTGTFGWAPSKDRVTPGDQSLDLFQYDIGLEGRASSRGAESSRVLVPFIGAGIGGRTYHYRDLNVDPRTNVAGYGALGGEFGFGRTGIRLEVRDYISQFKPLTGGGDTRTRNDVTVALGLTVRL